MSSPVTRTEALMRAFGWQGGTVHDLCKEIGCVVDDFLYNECSEYEQDHRFGWFAYRTNSLEYNRANILDGKKGCVKFWIGVADAVNCSIKQGIETPKKF